MKKITLKNTDLIINNICLGSGGFNISKNRGESFEIIDAFVSGGGNFIDTANVYGRGIGCGENYSEQLIGEWLKSRNAYNNVIVATKGAHYDLANPTVSRVTEKDICHDLDESLKALGLERIDFYWLHRDNPDEPVEYIIDTLESFVKEGKIRYYGASNYKLDRLKAAADYSKRKGYNGFCAVSNQWSMASINPNGNTNPDPTLVETSAKDYRWHAETGTPLIPYTSTAKGFFQKLHMAKPEIKGGKLITPIEKLQISDDLKKAYLNKRNVQMYEDLVKLSAQSGYSIQALSMAYLTNQPFQVIPITAVSKKEQLNDILNASNIIMDSGIIEKYSL